MNKRIVELYEKLGKMTQEVNEEVRKIQSECPHPKHCISFAVSIDNTGVVPTRMCEDCYAPLSGITDEERDEFLKSLTSTTTTESCICGGDHAV